MKTFQSVLTNFMNDFASRDAVCHLADQGLTVTEICGKLQFPTKKELVTEMVWKHYLDTGRIRLEEPTDKPFRFQWRSEEVDVPLMHETRTGYVNAMTREEWENVRKS